MKYVFYIMILLCSQVSLATQPFHFDGRSSYGEPVTVVPEDSLASVSVFAQYIASHYATPEECISAVYDWITHNVAYDIVMKNKLYFEVDEPKIAAETLAQRRGVCYHYATLLKAVADSLGLKAYSMQGYAKIGGKVEDAPHAWCVIQLEDNWYFFDPTFDSGGLRNGKDFVRIPKRDYYRKSPEEMIVSHMPFDPMWQFLSHPLSYDEFENPEPKEVRGELFNWKDSLNVYVGLSPIEQMETIINRILKNGTRNQSVESVLVVLRQNLQITKMNDRVERVNTASSLYNKALSHFNSFITYRNNQFKPNKEEAEVRKMITDCNDLMEQATKELEQIREPEPKILENMQNLKGLMLSLLTAINEQQQFVDKYYSTGKLFRKTLFYKIKWMGIPLN